MTIKNNLIKITILQVPPTQSRNNPLKKPFFPSLKFSNIFLIMTPNILHRRMKIQKSWDSRDFLYIFSNSKRRNLNLIRLSSFDLSRKQLHKLRIEHHQITIIKNPRQNRHFSMLKKKKKLIYPIWKRLNNFHLIVCSFSSWDHNLQALKFTNQGKKLNFHTIPLFPQSLLEQILKHIQHSSRHRPTIDKRNPHQIFHFFK